MNNRTFIKILSIALLLIIPGRAFAWGDYYAKLTAHVATGAGTVYVSGDQDVSPGVTCANIGHVSRGGGDVSLTAEASAAAGYKFDGWSNSLPLTSYISTVSSYSANYTASTTAASSNNNLNASEYSIYAFFSPISYTITYNPDGGVVSGGDSQSYTIESTETLRTASKFGCVFQGWKVRANSGSWTKDPVISNPSGTSLTGKYGDVTLDAQWVDLPELTISVSNLQNGESAIFNVSKGGSVLYTVAVGTSPVTIKYLEAGEYTVTPTSWSWAYTMSDTQQSQTLNNSDKKTVSFTATPKNDVKKHDEKSL